MLCENCPILEAYEAGCEKAYEEHCGEAHIVTPKASRNGTRRTGQKYRRRMDALKKAEELRNIELGKGRSWARYDYVDGEWVRVGNFAKHPKHSKVRKLMKRNTNKAVRRQPETYKGGHYRKIHDRWIYD